MHPVQRPRTHRKGGMLVIVAGSIVTLLGFAGFAIDIGHGLMARTDFQAAADAGALAAAMEYGQSGDVNRAREAGAEWARRNARDVALTVKASDVRAWNHPSGQKAFTVEWQQPVNTIFARFIAERFEVRAAASATLAQPTEFKEVWPLGLPATKDCCEFKVWTPAHGCDDDGVYQPLKAGTEYQIKAGGGGGNKSSHLILALDGRGAGPYREALANGALRKLRIGEDVELETGNMAGPTMQGAAGRIGDTVIIPLIDREDWEKAKGRANVTVVGFAAMRITRVEGGEIYGRFSRLTLPAPGRLGGTDAPGVTTPILVPNP